MAYSNYAITTATTFPEGPSVLTLTATAVSSSQIDLVWNAIAGAVGYRLERYQEPEEKTEGNGVINQAFSASFGIPQLAIPVITATQAMSGHKTASLSLEWKEVFQADRYLIEWASPTGDQWKELETVVTTYYQYVYDWSGIPLCWRFRVRALSNLGISMSQPSEEVLLVSPLPITLRLTKLDSNTVEAEFNGGNLGSATQVQLYHRYEGDLGTKFEMIYSGQATSYRHTEAKGNANRLLPYKNMYYIKIVYPNVGINTSYAVSETLGIDTYSD